MSYYDKNSDGTGRDVREHIARRREDMRLQGAREQTPWGQMQKLSRQIRRLEKDIDAYRFQRVDFGAAVDDKIAAAQAQIAQLKTQKTALHAEIEAEERIAQDAEWTREVTIARRAEWNEMAQAHPQWPLGKIEHETGLKAEIVKRYITKWEL